MTDPRTTRCRNLELAESAIEKGYHAAAGMLLANPTIALGDQLKIAFLRLYHPELQNDRMDSYLVTGGVLTLPCERDAADTPTA